MVFNPQTTLEVVASNFLRFIHPYLAFCTYRFHVEKARENGKFLEYLREVWPGAILVLTHLNELN